MDPPPSPGHSPPDSDENMATIVATPASNNMPGPLNGVNKRYRPAPAKTFQCRGYGECRMVFSRSEHLARHIRKHTGERPFSCHCSKQFSRLDNLRQHAQTVHADKQDLNERMMRDLTSLHASMAAANKVGGARGARRAPPSTSSGTNAGGGSPTEVQLNLIKQEEMGSLPMHQRPGTSTGYEGGDMMYASQPSWQVDLERPSSRTASSHSFRERGQPSSFREPGQSFLAPSSTPAAAAAAQSHSFLSFPGAGTSSRPATSSGATDTNHPRSLPPLAAVVSASIPSPPPLASQQQSQSIFPFHALRRPSTASSRPGTAPASASFFSRSFVSAGAGGGSGSGGVGSSGGRPDLSLLHSGFGGRAGFSASEQYVGAGEVPTSPGGIDASPFFFHPPALESTPASTVANTNASPPASNPRKRAFGGPDGPYDDAATPAHAHGHGHPAQQPPGSSSGLGTHLGDLNYDYGTESRPQSRRLSVMELCNDDAAEQQQQRPASQHQQGYATGPGAFLLSAAAAASGSGAGAGYGGGGGSRPTTSSGLVSGASALRLFDRTSSPPSAASPAAAASTATAALFARASHAAATAAGVGAAPGPGAADFGRRTVHALHASPSPGAGASPSSASSTASPSTPTPILHPSSSSAPTPAPYAPPGPTASLSGPGAPPVYRQQQHQYHALAHPPTFSSSPSSSGGYVGGTGPRSPASPTSSDSDASPRPFARAHAGPYASARRSPGGDVFPSPASVGGGAAGAGGPLQHGGYGGGHGAGGYAAAAAGYGRDDGDGARDDAGGQQRERDRDGQVRVGAAHAAASFGAMRA